MPESPKSTYGQILKSSALVGGSQVLSMALGILRTKVLAVLLGTGGMGMVGLYDSISRTAGTLAGMGIGSSGVRQISEAAGSGDQLRVARTIKALRRTALVLGLAGALGLVLFARPVSVLTFGDAGHTGSVALLACTVFFAAVAGGQIALVQGLRRISDLATLGFLGGLLGTLCSIPLIYFWGTAGVVPFLLAVSAASVLTSWWFARKIHVPDVALSWRETWQEARGLLGLGLAFMVTGLMAAGSAYLSRILIQHELGVDAVGIYLAAWTLAGYYVRFILQALAADFYPRLTAVASDDAQCNRLMNEQAEVALLLALPGVLATLVFAPLVIALFYSAKFAAASEILRWQVLGVLLQVTMLPLGYVVLAKGRSWMFVVLDSLSNLACVGFLWAGLRLWGLPGTGVAFFAQYLGNFIVIFLVVRRLTGYRWSRPCLTHLCVGIPAIAAVFAASFLLPRIGFIVFGSLATLAVGGWCGRSLYVLFGPSGVAAFKRKVRQRLGLAAPPV